MKFTPQRVAKAVVKDVEKVERKEDTGSYKPPNFFDDILGLAEPLLKPVSNIIKGMEGYGDYSEMPTTIHNNTIMGVNDSPEVASVPEMHSRKGAFRFSHREYIGDIPMTADFKINTFELDPTYAPTFPWLSTAAPTFQEWKLLGCVFEFVSLSANAISGTNAGMGSVSMSTRYDILQLPPKNKAEILNMEDAVSGKPTENMLLPIECDPEQTPMQPLFVHLPNIRTDQKWYSFGHVDVATSGASSNYPAAGELWITYDIMFLKPRLPTGGAPFSHATLSPWSDASSGILTTVAQPNSFDFGENLFGLSLSTDGSQLIFPGNLRAGEYFVYITAPFLGPGELCEPPTLTSSSPSLTLSDAFVSDSVPIVASNEGAGNGYVTAFSVSYDGSLDLSDSCYLSFSAYALPIAIAATGDLYVFYGGS